MKYKVFFKNKWFEKVKNFLQGEPKNTKELSDFIVDANERDVISRDTKDMMQGVLDVTTLKVRDIMIPRSQIIAIQKNVSNKNLLKIVIESAHSRFPVIYDDKDHIEGILLAKDLLRYNLNSTSDSFSLEDIIRPAVVVPESKRVDVLLKEFRMQRYHMAIVIDEYGGVSGLVTIEDILEEIVGDIEDEYDIDEQSKEFILKKSNNVYLIDALTPINTFNEYFASNFKLDDFATIGGLIANSFGHLPSAGESVTIEKFAFIVLKSDNRRLIELEMQIIDNAN